MERYVQLTGEDHARLAPEERKRLTVFHGTRCYMRMHDGRCAALEIEDGRFACSIYERRPDLCRVYERGGPACAHDFAVRGSETPALLGPSEGSRAG